MNVASIVDVSHLLLAASIEAGDTVVDATVGRGRDTCFLAERVGPSGTVYGFDTQTEAIASAHDLLAEQGLEGRVMLFRAGHETMRQQVPRSLEGEVATILFNLGYLPGGDPAIATQAKTTIRALEQALSLLRTNGLLLVVVYRGHPAGVQESNAIRSWAARLPAQTAIVNTYQGVNTGPSAPLLYAVTRQ